MPSLDKSAIPTFRLLPDRPVPQIKRQSPLQKVQLYLFRSQVVLSRLFPSAMAASVLGKRQRSVIEKEGTICVLLHSPSILLI